MAVTLNVNGGSVLTLGTGTFGGSGPLFSAWGNSQVAEATRLEIGRAHV